MSQIEYEYTASNNKTYIIIAEGYTETDEYDNTTFHTVLTDYSITDAETDKDVTSKIDYETLEEILESMYSKEFYE